MRRLTDLWFEASFYGRVDEEGCKGHRRLDSIEGAQGLLLWCPCGYGDPEFPLDGARPHALMIPFANPRNAPAVPADHGPQSKLNPDGPRPRWIMSGTSLEDLTLTPSIDTGCWHEYITLGEVG